MRKLNFVPETSSYAVQDSASEFLRVQLDGGAGRYRKDILNATRVIDCQWTLGPSDYDAFISFYRGFCAYPSPFLIDLVSEEYGMQECQAWFMPETLQVTKPGRLFLTINAQLEVAPPLRDHNYETSYWMMVSVYGSHEAALEIMNLLHHLVNVKLPPAVGAAA